MANTKTVLTLGEAALRVGVSKPAILQAVDRGRLKRRDDKDFDLAEVDAFKRGRGHVRGGKPGDRSRRASLSTPPQPEPPFDYLPLSDAPPGSNFHGVPARITDLALALICLPESLANILARYLPLAVVQTVVEEFMADQVAGWVGAAGGAPASIAEEHAWPAPPGGGEWHAHPAFSQPIPAWVWEAAGQEAAEWRGERGLPSP